MNNSPKHNYQLFEFAYFNKYDVAIKCLADLAEEEQWDFSNTEKYSILKNYLEYTFRKLKEEHKIAHTKDNKYAVFNTGLITKHLQSIYALFEENKIPGKSPFFFRAFVKESDTQLMKYFPSKNLPKVANYFKSPEDLIYNPELDLVINIDHIIERKERFPPHLKQDDDLRRSLKGAIDDVKKKIRTNYKLAIPQYHKGKIQLLLPLHLKSDTSNPDVALLVYKNDKTTYTSKNCFNLKNGL